MKFRGSDISGNALAGRVNFPKFPVPTWRFVSRSKTVACRLVNLTGKKLLLVSACKDAKAGKEKLATEGANPVATAVAQDPVALTRGVSTLNANAGTRGRVNAITRATLNKR